MILKLMEILCMMLMVWKTTTKLSGRDSFAGSDFVDFADPHPSHIVVS